MIFGLFKKKEKDITTSTAAQEINILDIKNNLIYTRDNLIIAILKINSLNMQLFSKKELINKIKDITSELSTETKEFKMTSIARPVDVGSLIDFLRNILNNSTDSIQKRLLRENYKNLEEKIKTGYSIVFLIKKDVDTDEIDYQKIKKDMNKIFKKAEIIVSE